MDSQELAMKPLAILSSQSFMIRIINMLESFTMMILSLILHPGFQVSSMQEMKSGLKIK
jgi:hypothetical protein